MFCPLKRVCATAIMTASLLLSAVSPAFSATAYKDVPSGHWAYTSVMAVSDKGLMVGDTSGNFKPNDMINKFDTAKTLAIAAGYKYTNQTAEERIFFDAAYNKFKPMLANYAKAFTKWISTTDKEVSFLLEKGILTESDLSQFVIKDTSGEQRMRALSRQEACIFLTRLINKQNDALTLKYKSDFNDDASISAAAKPYVYYMKSLGVISPDEKGNFAPNGAVVRASLAIMLDRTLALSTSNGNNTSSNTNANANTSNNANQNTSTSPPNNTNTQVDTVVGKIDKFYPSLNAVQIISGSTKKIFKMSPEIAVTINNTAKAVSDLKEGMDVLGVIKNDALVSLQTGGTNAIPDPTAPVPTMAPVATATPVPTTAPIATTAPTPDPTQAPSLGLIEGTVDSKAYSDNSITVNVRMLSNDGNLIMEKRKYTFDASANIVKGAVNVTFGDIANGDVVTLHVTGNNCTSLRIEERTRSFKGYTISDKRVLSDGITQIVVIKDKSGANSIYNINNNSFITRNGLLASWGSLRVGDTVDFVTEYEKIKDLYALSIKSNIEGTIEDISIKKEAHNIVVKTETGTQTYNVINSPIDVYALRIGMKIAMKLDSNEVESVTVLQDAPLSNITGIVSSIKSNAIVVSMGDGSGASKEVTLNASTVYLSSTSGNRIQLSGIKTGNKVYIVFSPNSNTVAKSVTVLL